MLTKLILPTLAAAFAVFAVPVTEANAGHGARGAKHSPCELVQCSADQAAKIDALRTAMKAEIEPLRAQKKTLMAAMHAERSKDNPDPAVLEELHDQKKALFGQMKTIRSGYVENMKKLLTPEQVAELDKRKAEWKANRGKNGKGKSKGKGKSQGKAKGKHS